ncbi:MAG: tetratricopeptide repeat protein [Rhizobiaceae bacterium]|nr:tetratricopeptide repeat protein [Rhizobiaceae bacterium]
MEKKRVTRRLAAIVAADVVGYSSQMGQDEEGTLRRIKQLRTEILEPNVTKNDGRIVKTTGDGTLIEFASAVDAVAHAIDVQSDLAKRNASMPDEQHIVLRMGINLGDVIIEDDDIFGDGVNIAARLETLANPGGICISSRVYDLVAGKFDVDYDDLGPQALKNITNPIVAYNLELERGANEKREDSGRHNLPLPDKPSIAILPFDNLGGDPDQDYFSDGMTDDIITDLSKIPELFVIARNSSFVFKGQVVDAKEIGRRLGVRYLLEGSVRRVASKIRINAQLIDTATEGHVWADRYDGSLDDIFLLQDELTGKIVNALELAISKPDQGSSKTNPVSGESYDLFLRARKYFYQFTPDSLAESQRLLHEVLKLDPQLADAYSLLSYCQFVEWNIYMGDNSVLEGALNLATKGVALAPESGSALARLGWIYCFMQRYEEALGTFEKAAERSPNDADVFAYYGEALNYADEPARGLEMIEKGIRLDPLGPSNWDFHRGHALYKLDRSDEAIAAISQSINRGPNFPVPYLYLAVLHVEQGQQEKAEAAVKSALQHNPLWRLESVARVIPHRSAEKDRFLDGLRKAGLPE